MTSRRPETKVHNIFDPIFNGMPHSEMYRAQLTPELFPHQKRMLLENWPAEDREMYVGGKYTKGYV